VALAIAPESVLVPALELFLMKMMMRMMTLALALEEIENL
jgi:hypothetical protein